MKNVLHIMDFAAPYGGNFIASIECLEKHVNSSGNCMVYLFPEGAKKYEWCINFQNKMGKVYFIDETFFSKKIKLINILYIKNIVKKERIGIIHTNFMVYNYSLYFIKKLFIRRIIFIGQFQNHFLPPKNILKGLRIYITNSTYDRIIGVSESVVESIEAEGIPQNKVFCVRNSLAKERLEDSTQYQLKDNKNQKVVLMFGWPFIRKGVDIAVETIRQLNEDGVNVLLAISLSGGQTNIEIEIKNQLGELPKWIKFLKPREDVATYYNAANIFLSSSREEGYTFAVLEAAYCRCMVIVSTTRGNPQDIPYSGKYEISDILHLKKLIIEMLGKTETELEVIREIQREFVVEAYDLNSWAKKIMQVYQNN